MEPRTMEKVFEIYIRTTPERLWEAITDPEIRSKYLILSGVKTWLGTGELLTTPRSLMYAG